MGKVGGGRDSLTARDGFLSHWMGGVFSGLVGVGGTVVRGCGVIDSDKRGILLFLIIVYLENSSRRSERVTAMGFCNSILGTIIEFFKERNQECQSPCSHEYRENSSEFQSIAR